MTSHRFDIVVLGTGPAASRIAVKCAESKRVAIVEKRTVGGTCALRGCNPKKVLVRAAELVDWSRRSDGQLVLVGDASIYWRQLIDFTRTFTDPVPDKSREKYEEAGITLFEGSPRFTGADTLEVDGVQISAEHVVIATGARPFGFDFPGSSLISTSDEFFELDFLPPHVLFVGGGYISTEFAHVASRAGAEVTIVERGERLLNSFDPDHVELLADYMQDELGMDVRCGSEVQAVREQPDGSFKVEIKVDDRTEELRTDLIVHGGGRVPNLDDLALDVAGIEANKQGVVVNEYLQSVSNPHIFAAGDCAATGQPKLTPVANQEGRTVARNLLEKPLQTPDYGAVPQAVFSVPALASVGLQEAEAREQNLDVDVRSGDMSEWGSIRKVGTHPAAYKVIVDKQSDQILGAHLLAVHAAETINYFAMAMTHKLTAKDVKSVLFAFPTFASDVRQML